MNEHNKDVKDFSRKRYCKACRKEIMAIREPKTPGKRVANFFGIITLGAQIYSYPRRCPYCGKKTIATKSQRILIGVGLIIFFSVGFIVFISLRMLSPYS